MVEANNTELLWVQRYRPKTVRDTILPADTKAQFQKFVDDKNEGEVLTLNKLGNLVSSEEGAITRLISTLLRHGVEVHYIVHQLEKVKGDMNSFSKTVARAIKKYIPNGTVVKGEKCGSCESESLIRQEGCVTCKSCGFSKCG